jgi:hypothetical protein
VQYAVFQLTKELRGLSVEDLRTSLVTRLQSEAVDLTFSTQPYLNKRTGIQFESHPAFKKADLEQRFGLYQSIADQLWSIERLQGVDSVA